MSRIEEAITLAVKFNDLNHNLARGKAGRLMVIILRESSRNFAKSCGIIPAI